MKRKLKVAADVATYALTLATPLLALLKLFTPGQAEDPSVRFGLFCVTAALPDLVCLTIALWLCRVVIRKWKSVRALFAWPVRQNRLKMWRWVLAAAPTVVGLTLVTLGCFQAKSYLRARGRFYVYLFRSAYEQVAEREHLFASVTWQSERSAQLGTELLNSFAGRPDERALRARVRGYKGFEQYCAQLDAAGKGFREATGGDHRLAVDYYCELLSLAPRNATAREQLKSLRNSVLAQESDVRLLYRLIRNGNDSQALLIFGKVKGYLFENTISNKLNGHLAVPEGNKLSPELKQFVLSFADENLLVKMFRQSWRVDLIDLLIKKSEDCEHVAALWPRRWSEVGKLLLGYDLAAYSRAIFNALTGLRPLQGWEQKLRIQALCESGEGESALRACRQYLRFYPLDNDVRVAMASAIACQDKDKSDGDAVVELLAPLGVIPASYLDEVFNLRVNAFNSLERFSVARVEALNWVEHNRMSLRARIALGVTESKLADNERLQPVIDILNSFARDGVSINQADDKEIDQVEQIISFILERLDEKAPAVRAEQKADLSLAVQRTVYWLWLEMPNRPELAARLVTVGAKLDPSNPALQWMSLEEELKKERGDTMESSGVLEPRPADLPAQFRYRILDAQQRIKAATALESVSAQPTQTTTDEQSNSTSAVSNEDLDAWRRAQFYSQPREEVFQFGYDLYTSPSLQARKITSIRKKISVIVAGEIKVDGIRFFVSSWSLERFRNGQGGSYLKPMEVSSPSTSQQQYPGLKLLKQIEERSFQRGYQVFDGPSKGSHLVKAHETGSCRVAAYLDTNEGRFYLSDYSLERYQKHLAPFWWIREID
jgi:hypothetical protein